LKKKLTNLETATHLWGISPETVFIFLTDLELGVNNLENLIKLERVETKIHKNKNKYKKSIKLLTKYLGLVKDQKISPLGTIVLVHHNPVLFIQTCLMARDYQLRNLIVDLINKETKRMTLSEIETYFPGEGNFYCKLLESFHFLKIKGRHVIFDLRLIKQVGTIKSFQRKTENWLCGKSFIASLVGKNDTKLVSVLTSSLLRQLNIPFEENELELDITDAIKHVGAKAENVIELIISDKAQIATTLEKIRQEYSNENDQILRHLLSFRTKKDERAEINNVDLQLVADRFNLEQRKLIEVINQLLFLQKTFSQIYVQYVIDISKKGLDVLTKMLAEIFGESIRIDSYFIRFLKNFAESQKFKGNLQDYLTFVFKAFAKNEERIKKLEAAKNFFLTTGTVQNTIGESKAKEIIHDRLNKTLLKRFSPFYFVYTLPLPENLGKEVIGKYKGKSDELEREVYKLGNEWSKKRTETSFTFNEMADRLLSKGIECELQTKEIRIMTPFTDYEIEKYVSMLRSLIMKGYIIRIICRLHSKSKLWERFRDGLFKGLGKKSESVQVRTYTRFKEYKSEHELKKLKEQQRKEFGIHAKLFIIGDPADGALLLGSANLLKNSYHWNPEAGLYTEDPTFIESAMRFFDFVWDLAEKDALDLSSRDQIPKGPFFPSSYRN